MNAFWMATLAFIKRARNLVAFSNLVKSMSGVVAQLFPAENAKNPGLLGPGGNLVRLVAYFRERGRALPPCVFLPRAQRVAVQSWSGAENPVRTSQNVIDQDSTPRVPQRRALHGETDNPVTRSAIAGGAQ